MPSGETFHSHAESCTPPAILTQFIYELHTLFFRE